VEAFRYAPSPAWMRVGQPEVPGGVDPPPPGVLGLSSSFCRGRLLEIRTKLLCRKGLCANSSCPTVYRGRRAGLRLWRIKKQVSGSGGNFLQSGHKHGVLLCGLDVEPLAQRAQGRVNAIDFGGMAQVGKPIDFLPGGAEAARQVDGAHLLPQHFV